MKHYHVPDHLGVCEVDDRLLMLDLRRDRYFQLDSRSTALLKRWRDDVELEDADLARLVERGLLAQSDRPRLPRWTETIVSRRSLLDDSPPVSGAALLLPEIARDLWQARRNLGRGLEHAIDEVKRSSAGAPRSDARLPAARFRAARRLIPLAPNCLTDSLALAGFLARRRIRCDLVFGVKLDPFAAHCWIQTDDLVLNDAADTVAGFKPILVI